MALKGQITLDEINIIEVTADPSSIGNGIIAPIGSIAFLNGTTGGWQKFGSNDTDWKKFSPQLTPDITHVLTALPDIYRATDLNQILNDISEDLGGNGYLVPGYTGALVTTLTSWDAPAMNKRRAVATITYTGVFASTIAVQTYNEAGSAVVATATSTITYNANKTVQNISTVVTRP